MRKAVLVNSVLVMLAFVLPRAFAARGEGFAGAAAAALLFAIPMVVALVIGMATAIQSYLASRRQNEPMPWMGVAPLGIFGVGVLALIALIAARL
jgi:hypothetical protein